MPTTLEELRDLQLECFADDVPVQERMCSWTIEQARAYFESGGVEPPSPAALLKPLKVMPPPLGALMPISPPRSPRSGARAFQLIKIFGDSHVNTFITIEAAGSGALPLQACPFTAGSAMGLRHSDSITGYREALEGDLYATKPTDVVVLKFGQVDCDFVYYLKLAENPTLRFDDFAADSVRKYLSFVDDALAALPVTRENLVLMTPFATCVPDEHLRDSLCTLPFMDATFRLSFRQKLEGMALPSLSERTAPEGLVRRRAAWARLQ